MHMIITLASVLRALVRYDEYSVAVELDGRAAAGTKQDLLHACSGPCGGIPGLTELHGK